MNTQPEQCVGTIEFQSNDGEWNIWEVVKRGDTLVVGTACNVGLLESYSMQIEDGESLDQALQELHADLEVEANDGPKYMSRLA